MERDRIDNTAENSERSKRQKTIDVILKVGAFFVILEPIWMLLPFAGFLYGSVMHIQFLSQNPYTAWLVHFVLPTHTLFPLGIILIVVGFSIFIVGAFQIYSAKLLNKGMVKSGIYKKFRNPQYVSLTIFGLGIILTWGRFITYIAFFIMMWLYYFLSKIEERKCLALFGKEYEEYRNTTYFLFPGERVFLSAIHKFSGMGLPAWANVVVSFIIVMAISIGSGLLAQSAKGQLRNQVPTIDGVLNLSQGSVQDIDLVMVKGPVLQAAPFKNKHQQFWDSSYKMLISSAKIKQALYQLNIKENQSLLAFCTPGSNWRSPDHHDYRHAKVNAYIVVTTAPVHTIQDIITGSKFTLPVLKTIRAQELSYDRLEKGLDPTEGKVAIAGPPAAGADPMFQKRVQDRISFLLSGM